MFSSKSVLKGEKGEKAKSFLSENGILFSEEDIAGAGRKSAEHLSDASRAPVAYQNFLGDIFHRDQGEKEETAPTDGALFREEELLSTEDGGDDGSPERAVRPEEEADADTFPIAAPSFQPERNEEYSTVLVQQSIARAEKLLDMARREAEKIKEDAYVNGYEEGRRLGREDGRRIAKEELRLEYQEKVDAFYKECSLTLGTIEDLKRQRLSRYLDELKDVAIAVAEKVIHVSLASSGEVIRKMILQEAEKLKRTSWLKIYIDKAAYEMLLETDSQVASELAGVSRNIRFVISEKSEMGKLIMETPDEIIDMSIGTQMENLRTKLSQVGPRVDES